MTKTQIEHIREIIRIIGRVGANRGMARIYLLEILGEYKATDKEIDQFLAELELVLGKPKKRPPRRVSAPAPTSLVENGDLEPIVVETKASLKK
jgi:hypothetical protein